MHNSILRLKITLKKRHPSIKREEFQKRLEEIAEEDRIYVNESKDRMQERLEGQKHTELYQEIVIIGKAL